MLEVHGLHLEGQLAVVDLPALRQGLFLPVSAAGLAPQIPGVSPLPGGVLMGRLPDGLGVRAHQELLVPAFQLLSPAAIQKFIVLPLVRDPHRCFLRVHSKSCYYTAKASHSSIRFAVLLPAKRKRPFWTASNHAEFVIPAQAPALRHGSCSPGPPLFPPAAPGPPPASA